MQGFHGGVNAGGGFSGLSAFNLATTQGAVPFADRTWGVGFDAASNVQVSRQDASVSGSVGVSGLLTLVLLVGALVALDRYVLDVPGVGA